MPSIFVVVFGGGFEMVKKEQIKEVEPVYKKNSPIKFMVILLVVAAVAVLGYKAYEDPKLVQQLKDLFNRSAEQEDIYQPQIDKLSQQITALQGALSSVSYKAENPDLSAINQRIDDIQQISVNTIKSKANLETVLGIIGRMDAAEGRLNDLSKVTDDGALILTAAMLVREAGQRGDTFVYEAEVLSELAAGHHKIAKEVERLNEIATKGVPSVVELQKEFAEVYMKRYPDSVAQEEEEIEATNWKERISSQLHKVVRIKKTTETDIQPKEPVLSEEDRAWSVVKDFVLSGDISRAVGIIEKPLNQKLLENEDLVHWLDNARLFRDFYADVSRISANGLAVMKVKFLKKG